MTKDEGGGGVWFALLLLLDDGVDLWLVTVVEVVSSLDEMLVLLSMDDENLEELGGTRRREDGVFLSGISLAFWDADDGISEIGESDGSGDTDLAVGASIVIGSWRDNDGEERLEVASIAPDLACVDEIKCSSTLRVMESRNKMFSSDEFDFQFDVVGEEGILTGKDTSFGIRLGEGEGDGVLLREYRGKGKSWVSSSSSIGEERSSRLVLRESRVSGPEGDSSMVDADDDTVELEEVSRGFTRGYSEPPEEEAKGDAEGWDDDVRIRSVSSKL